MSQENSTEWPLAVYIAGPISSDPDYRQKFAAAEARLKAAGYFPMNPAVLPYPGLPYESYMRISGAMLSECGAIHMLPGWETSPGAQGEYSQAIADAMLFVDDDMNVSRVYKSKPTIENLQERGLIDNMESRSERKYYITDRQREQAERMAAKWEARAEAYYSDGEGWGFDTAGYCKTPEEAEQATEQAEKIHAAIGNLLGDNGTWADVQLIRTAVSNRDELDAQVAINRDIQAHESAAIEPKPSADPVLPDKPDPLKDIMDTLEKGVTDLFESDRYKQYLDTLSKFHSYSLNNTILIAMQKPDATLVAGYNAWQKSFKRFVRKGEKGIKIIAPMPQTVKLSQPDLDAAGKPIRDENGQTITHEVERSFVKYRVASVFDVSQTDGQPLPRLIPEIKETPSPSVLGHPFFLTLEKVASPVPISIDMPPGSKARGMYSSTENKIYIDHRHSESMVFKTLIHEISHARLHSGGPASIDRQTAEVQAESIAYTVCAHYGLDTSDYSFGYIVGWSGGKDAKELKASLEIIRTEAAAIIEKVDEYYPIEYDRWAKDLTLPEPAPDLPDRADIFSKLLEREDIQYCATIAGKAGCYEDFIKTLDTHSSMIADGSYATYMSEDEFTDLQISPSVQDMMDSAATTTAAYYRAVDNSIERGRVAAKEAGLPFSEHLSAGANDEHDPYTYDGSMTPEDYDAMHAMHNTALHPSVPENPLRTAELSMEQNENMIDGVLNNSPSPGEVAAQGAASSPPDFSDLRGTLDDCKREAAMSLASPVERPSIQQRLEQYKAQAADRAETLPRRQKRHMEVER